ncbi:hypothetical protein PJK47_30850, partial [Mycobacterium kansasii]
AFLVAGAAFLVAGAAFFDGVDLVDVLETLAGFSFGFTSAAFRLDPVVFAFAGAAVAAAAFGAAFAFDFDFAAGAAFVF